MKKLHIQRICTHTRTEEKVERNQVNTVSIPVYGYKVLRTVNTLYPPIGTLLNLESAAYYVDQNDWEVTVE